MFNAWYEVLSVLHLMAMLLLSQANLLLLPRTFADGYQPKVSEGCGYLDCDVRHVLPQLPSELKCAKMIYLRNLPVDLPEGVLRALCLQALGQVTIIFNRYIVKRDTKVAPPKKEKGFWFRICSICWPFRTTNTDDNM
ncbi:hypothetical protein Gotur_000244 [Gossypium turneri]